MHNRPHTHTAKENKRKIQDVGADPAVFALVESNSGYAHILCVYFMRLFYVFMGIAS
jgi:hypothetical protein